MIIDMHVHAFADALAPRALEKLRSVAGIPAYSDLTEADTRRKLREWGIDLGVVMPIATKPGQQRAINDWAAGLQGDGLLSFGTVHPDAPDALGEMERVRELGLRGVKFHPDYQGFRASERRVYPLYAKAEELGLPVLFHAGFDPVSPDEAHCLPAELVRVSEDFPDLAVIGAHMGGNKLYDEVERTLMGRDVYIDISVAPMYCSFEQFERIVRNHDPDRVLFASDCPWSFPPDEIEWVRRLSVPAETREKIFWKNAARLLSLPQTEE